MLNDLVDMTAAVTDHEFDVYDSGGQACGHVRNVQIDHHAAGAVGIDLVSALFLPWRREVVARETLGEVALAVEHLDAVDDLRRRRRRVEAPAAGAVNC